MNALLAGLLITGSLTWQGGRDTRLGQPLRPEPTLVLYTARPLRGRLALSGACIYNARSRLLFYNAGITVTLKKP